MTTEQFCYWLQGFVEMRNARDGGMPSKEQWEMVCEHLKTVLSKVTQQEYSIGIIGQPSINPLLNQPRSAIC